MKLNLMKSTFILLIFIFITSCVADKETAIYNIKYQKAKSECIGKVFIKKDKFKKCVDKKMSK